MIVLQAFVVIVVALLLFVVIMVVNHTALNTLQSTEQIAKAPTSCYSFAISITRPQKVQQSDDSSTQHASSNKLIQHDNKPNNQQRNSVQQNKLEALRWSKLLLESNKANHRDSSRDKDGPSLRFMIN